jgi:hypothetical protein
MSHPQGRRALGIARHNHSAPPSSKPITTGFAERVRRFGADRRRAHQHPESGISWGGAGSPLSARNAIVLPAHTRKLLPMRASRTPEWDGPSPQMTTARSAMSSTSTTASPLPRPAQLQGNAFPPARWLAFVAHLASAALCGVLTYPGISCRLDATLNSDSLWLAELVADLKTGFDPFYAFLPASPNLFPDVLGLFLTTLLDPDAFSSLAAWMSLYFALCLVFTQLILRRSATLAPALALAWMIWVPILLMAFQWPRAIILLPGYHQGLTLLLLTLVWWLLGTGSRLRQFEAVVWVVLAGLAAWSDGLFFQPDRTAVGLGGGPDELRISRLSTPGPAVVLATRHLPGPLWAHSSGVSMVSVRGIREPQARVSRHSHAAVRATIPRIHSGARTMVCLDRGGRHRVVALRRCLGTCAVDRAFSR